MLLERLGMLWEKNDSRRWKERVNLTDIRIPRRRSFLQNGNVLLRYPTKKHSQVLIQVFTFRQVFVCCFFYSLCRKMATGKTDFYTLKYI